MKKNNLLYIIGIVISLITLSCADQWDDHYTKEGDSDSSISGLNLYDYLSEQPQYSQFMTLLDSTKVGEELAKNQVLTVWPVSNDNMPDWTQMSRTDQIRLARNHVNYMALYYPKLENGKVVKTLAGKNLILNLEGSGFALDGKQLTEPNQLCSNGVAHEVSGVMIPRYNIYEYIVTAGDEYSMFRDSLLVNNDTVFDILNSFPIGVDEVGNTIYDSIFVIENPYFNSGDFRNENGEFTLFIPTNKMIEDALQNINDLYEGDVTEDEEYIFFDWVMKAVIHKGIIENYESDLSLESLFGKDWRTSYQFVDDNPYRASNGLVYNVSHLHIPRNLLLQTIHYVAPDSWNKLTTAEQAEYYVVENATNIVPVWVNAGTFFNIEGTTPEGVGQDLSVEFTILDSDRFGRLKPARFFAGEYEFRANFRPYGLPRLKVYVNDELYNDDLNANDVNGPSVTTYGLMPPHGKIVIPESTPVTTVRIKIVTDKISATLGYKRIAVAGFRFEPDASIY